MIYSYAYIVPQQVKRVYENNAFREKNNFVNNMTQILTNNEKTVLQALKTVADRANGEFKEDLLKLQAKIVDGNNQDIQDSFQWLASKYESDVIFSLYVEQLTTLVIEGRHNIETLKDIKTYHNEIKKRQWWRPVAPIILKECIGDWFINGEESEYMLRTFFVLPDKKDLVPAVLHLDNSARVQTIAKEGDYFLYK